VTYHQQDGQRKTVRLGTVGELDEVKARERADEVIRLNGMLPPDPDPTLAQFVKERFIPEYADVKLKHAGKLHYESLFKLILPTLGDKKFKEIVHQDLQKLINERKDEGYSWQTLKHIKSALSAIFRHGMERTNQYVPQTPGMNPARGIILPPKALTRKKHAATIEQCRALLAALPCHPHPPVREMARMAICCSCSQAEFLGLRWQMVNLTEAPITVDGEQIPPRAIRIVANLYKGQFGTTKTPGRVRNVPLPAKVVEELTVLQGRGHDVGPDDLVFCSRSGHHVLLSNLNRAFFRPITKRLDLQISWHELRHSHASLVQALGMSYLDAQANMGHLGGSTTLNYTHPDIERRREFGRAVVPID